jgi:hypothetical protein
MNTATTQTPTVEAPLYVPAEWAPARDVALDLLRGLAMVVLVINHTALESPLRDATRAVVSAAEVLVLVSGVVVGMVFGRRWREHGARATSAMLLRRARKLYLASVVVVALVGLARLVPWLDTAALTVSPRLLPLTDSYAYDGILRTLVAIVTLEAGPWQFNILGFFVAVLALAPVVLWALARGRWAAVLGVSAGLYLLGREWSIDVIPSQSERAFPLPIWQLLFVGGLVAGWHRERVARALRSRGATAAVVAVAAGFALFALLAPDALLEAHFHKGSLDPLRLAAMASFAAALYLALRRAGRHLEPVLLPLGCNSFYVFIMHVFVCLAVASLPLALPGVGNALVQVACVGALCLMARRRFLFRWVPR